MEENAASPDPRDARAVTREAMVQSALLSAARAQELGMAKNRMILSAKVSAVQDLIAVCTKSWRGVSDYAIHLGLTEAGMGSKGIVASFRRARHSAAGRHRRTPSGFRSRPSRRRPHGGSSGRAGTLADHGFSHLRAAGCGLSRLRPHHLDHVPGTGALDPGFHPRGNAGLENAISRRRVAQRRGSWVASSTAPANPSMPISASRYPAPAKAPAAPVFVDGKKFRTLRGPTIAADFKALVIDYIDQRYGSGSKAPVTAAE